ncbi:hypothetical protein EV424DRAFT_1626133 [Suillus variegatus]|nr:hypothetical protein EV424DRAFT_1626133 [Suillus variegatus]
MTSSYSEVERISECLGIDTTGQDIGRTNVWENIRSEAADARCKDTTITEYYTNLSAGNRIRRYNYESDAKASADVFGFSGFRVQVWQVGVGLLKERQVKRAAKVAADDFRSKVCVNKHEALRTMGKHVIALATTGASRQDRTQIGQVRRKNVGRCGRCIGSAGQSVGFHRKREHRVCIGLASGLADKHQIERLNTGSVRARVLQQLPNAVVINAANAVTQWVKKEEGQLFLKDALVF